MWFRSNPRSNPIKWFRVIFSVSISLIISSWIKYFMWIRRTAGNFREMTLLLIVWNKPKLGENKIHKCQKVVIKFNIKGWICWISCHEFVFGGFSYGFCKCLSCREKKNELFTFSICSGRWCFASKHFGFWITS